HPTPVRYRGMPAERYWEFEDGNVNFAGAEAGVTDLLRISVTEFALTFGNDWFLVPVRLPVGWVHHVSEFAITDSFGAKAAALPIVNPNGSQWTMYALTTDESLQHRFNPLDPLTIRLARAGMKRFYPSEGVDLIGANDDAYKAFLKLLSEQTTFIESVPIDAGLHAYVFYPRGWMLRADPTVEMPDDD